MFVVEKHLLLIDGYITPSILNGNLQWEQILTKEPLKSMANLWHFEFGILLVRKSLEAWLEHICEMQQLRL